VPKEAILVALANLPNDLKLCDPLFQAKMRCEVKSPQM